MRYYLKSKMHINHEYEDFYELICFKMENVESFRRSHGGYSLRRHRSRTPVE